MPTYSRPGVYIEESVTQTNAGTSGSPEAVACFIAPWDRGPTALGATVTSGNVGTLPSLVTSWNDFVTKYGGFTPDLVASAHTTYLAQANVTTAAQFLPHSVYQFFANGGSRCYVSRLLGAGGVAASFALQTPPTAADTLRVKALNEGTWGNNIWVSVTTSGTRFSLTIAYSSAVITLANQASSIVERWNDLSMSPADSRYAPSVLNSATAGSKFVALVDIGVGAAAGVNPAASVTSPSRLASGATGTGPTTTAGSGHWAVAGGVLENIPSPLVISAPSLTSTASSSVLAALGLSAANKADSMLLTHAAPGSSASALFTATTGDADVLRTALTAASVDHSLAALYAPWVTVKDPSSSAPNVTISVPPDGIVAGLYAANDTARGVFKTPAGTSARLSSAVALETTFSTTEEDSLNTANVNALKFVPGAGICVFGGRTLKQSAADQYLSVRRSLLYLKSQLLTLSRYAVFEPNNADTWRGLRSVFDQTLYGFWQQGGLRGATPAQAFYVRCDETNNTPSSVAQGQLVVEVGVALQYPAEFVIIRIGQWEGGQSATES